MYRTYRLRLIADEAVEAVEAADGDLETVCESDNGALAAGSEAHTGTRTTGRSESLLAYVMSAVRSEYQSQVVLSSYLTYWCL